NALGTGELLRAAIGRPHLRFVLRHDKNIVLSFLVAGWWLSMAAVWFVTSGLQAVLAMTALALLPFVAMTLRWRSFRHGLYSVPAWNVYALAFTPGALRPHPSPTRWIDSKMVADPLVPSKQRASAPPAGRPGTAAVSSQPIQESA